MGIKDDIKKVVEELNKSVEANGEVDLAYMMQEIVMLFEKVKLELPKTNAEERKEVFAAMEELQAFLNNETKRLAERTGLSPEQLSRFAENPDNFSKEQWGLIENVRTKLGAQTEEIRAVLRVLPAVQSKNSPEGEPASAPAPKKKSKKRKSSSKPQMRA